jgi:ankyrin repeat protein
MAPLPNAVRADRPLMVAVLLHFGADLKRPLPGQVSCLHLAAEKASLRTIRVLVEAGADRTALDAQQRTPQDIARAKGRGPEVLAALAPAS